MGKLVNKVYAFAWIEGIDDTCVSWFYSKREENQAYAEKVAELESYDIEWKMARFTYAIGEVDPDLVTQEEEDTITDSIHQDLLTSSSLFNWETNTGELLEPLVDKAFVVALKRSDGTQPKLCKVIDEKFHLVEEDAIAARNTANSRVQGEPFGVFPIDIKILNKEL